MDLPEIELLAPQSHEGLLDAPDASLTPVGSYLGSEKKVVIDAELVTQVAEIALGAAVLLRRVDDLPA